MRIAFAGTPDVAIPSLRALLAAGHDVAAVITRPDAPAGRGRVLTASPVALFAAEHGIPVLKPTKLVDIADELAALNVDCIPVVAYGGLVPAAMLDIPTYGWMNLHFSLLPAWRGAAPVQRALMAGDLRTGATVFRLVEALDAGPVFGSIERAITPADTATSLLAALADDGAALLARTVDTIDDVTPMPQPATGVSYAPKLSKDDARIVWNLPAARVDCQIRGCAPGAWTTIAGERIGIGPIRLRDDVTLPAGSLRFDDDVLVGTGTHAVQLDQVKPAGKDWMSAAAWARGLRVKPEHVDAN